MEEKELRKEYIMDKYMKTIAFIRTTNIYDDSRATKEIVALAEAGYKVVVLGWDRNGIAEDKAAKIFDGREIELHFFQCILPSGIGIKNIDKLIKWFKWTEKKLEMLSDLYAVHACNLDGGYGAFRFCKKNNIHLIYDIYDYYIDSHSIPRKLSGIIERMEIEIINRADVTIICTEERREQIKKANPKKLMVIHNSPDVQNLVVAKDTYDYAYCGSLCELRLIKETIDEYENNKDLKIAYAGNDKYKNYVETLANQYDNLVFFGTISYQEVLEIESTAKVLSAIYEPSIRNHQLCAPNKFYEALALGKPIIVCKGTGIDKIVRENDIGVVIGYDAKEFYDALKWLINNEDVRGKMGKRARELYDRKYAWSQMRIKLINEYDNLESLS